MEPMVLRVTRRSESWSRWQTRMTDDRISEMSVLESDRCGQDMAIYRAVTWIEDKDCTYWQRLGGAEID